MIREEGLDEIWDGRYYSGGDLVRCASAGCSGCSACCHFTSDTIILDPLDVMRIERAVGKTFLTLLEENLIHLRVVDGLILPHIQMKAEKGDGQEGGCPWLSDEGLCTIHENRPDLCRLFPLGRIWNEDGTFRYILQKDACVRPGRSKVEVNRWLELDTKEKAESDRLFHERWHALLVSLRKKMAELETDQQRSALSLYLLRNFYDRKWMQDEERFYKQFAIRCRQAEDGM